MIVWFAGGACLIVWMVFGDPRIDFRLVALGALLPDLLDAPFGGARLLHTLAFSVALLFGVMVLTRRGDPRRRSLLALPIGTFLHLALDGMWTHSEVFWWPFFGGSFGDVGLPSLDRPVLLLLVQEAAGLAALLWFVAQRRATVSAAGSEVESE